MIPRFCLLVFVAGSAFCTKDIDKDTLFSVFGLPKDYVAQPSAASPQPAFVQAVPVTPETDALTDPDYWDKDELPTAIVPNYDNFDLVLTKRVASWAESNMLLSPLGLKLALAILAEAATGLTKSELEFVLDLPLNRTETRRKFSNIIESLQKPSTQYVLNLGSKIYVENNVHPRQMYAAIAHQFYKTDITPLDFKNTPVAAKTINDWVFNITQGRIAQLVSENDIADAVVFILNTLFFKGSWRHQFAPNETKTGDFYVTPTLKKPVQYMNVRENFFYTESAKMMAKIVRMPYQGNKFAMYLIVPNSLTGMNYVLEDLTNLQTELQGLTERLVDITLPKWNFEYTAQLDGVLRGQGVREAFRDTASFPGIARGQTLNQRLKVSKVLQRSGIEVNELGSVAYSATEIALVNKFGEDDESAMEVKATHPFFFFIQDETTRQLLFTGRISDPTLDDGAFNHVFMD